MERRERGKRPGGRHITKATEAGGRCFSGSKWRRAGGVGPGNILQQEGSVLWRRCGHIFPTEDQIESTLGFAHSAASVTATPTAPLAQKQLYMICS